MFTQINAWNRRHKQTDVEVKFPCASNSFIARSVYRFCFSKRVLFFSMQRMRADRTHARVIINITSISHEDFHSSSYLIQTVLSVRLRVHFDLHHHRVRSSYMAEHFGEVFCLWSTRTVRKTALTVVFSKHPTSALAHFPQAFYYSVRACG